VKIFFAFLILIFSIQSWTKADVIVIVKNTLDESIFIKRKRTTEKDALNSAMEGCLVLFRYNESLNLSNRKKMMDACYIYKVLDFDNL
tara:strand:- start:123 stop:386 length:264 start_codon:yes stop_codon:yes gene_type:complete